jgi:Ca2+/Na+ antiporter
MIIVNSFRILAIILLVIILIIKDIPFKSLFKDVMIQFYLASICMLLLLLFDNIFGFILSICLLSLYFRIYTSEFNNKKDTTKEKETEKETEKERETEKETERERDKYEHDNYCNHREDDKTTPKDPSNDKCVMNMAHLNYEKRLPIPTDASTNNSTCNSLVPYITEENLLAAQSNIVNPLEYNNEFFGVDKGIYNEDVYGSQGLDTKKNHIRGYDTNNIYLGSLSYEMI